MKTADGNFYGCYEYEGQKCKVYIDYYGSYYRVEVWSIETDECLYQNDYSSDQSAKAWVRDHCELYSKDWWSARDWWEPAVQIRRDTLGY